MSRHYIMYISGLGDGYDPLRAFFVSTWRIFGVQTQHIGMRWNNTESYEDKVVRIKSAIQAARKQGYLVSLVGESAGASIAMNVFAGDNDIHRFVSLCGVNTAKTPISPHIFKRKPAFKKAISLLEESRVRAVSHKLDRIITITSARDPSVPVRINRIPGSRHITIRFIGHLTTIFFCLSLGSYIVVRAIKRS